MERRYGETEISQLTDRKRDALTSPADVLETAIADSSEEVDKALVDGGYALPLASVPGVLVRHVCALTRCYLYDGMRPSDVKEDCEKAMDWLEAIALGKTKLPGQTPEEPQAAGGVAVNARERVYSDDLWATY